MNTTTLLLAGVVALGVLMIFIGLSRTPSTNTALMVQQRLSVYGGGEQLTVAGVARQRPFRGRVLWLKQKVDGRRTEVQKGLPDALDLLVICVDAGLGFDAALARVTDKYKNALSELLSKALREVSLGRPRLEALDEMGRNSGVEDLHNFIQAVIQSEQFGTGIGKILRIQADEMRRKRRQRAQERGAQATLKMMLPMVGCIFPTLWIVLLGPAVLILMRPR